MLAGQYLSYYIQSLYYGRVQKWRATFQDRFKVVLYDDLRTDPLGTYEQVQGAASWVSPSRSKRFWTCRILITLPPLKRCSTNIKRDRGMLEVVVWRNNTPLVI